MELAKKLEYRWNISINWLKAVNSLKYLVSTDNNIKGEPTIESVDSELLDVDSNKKQ